MKRISVLGSAGSIGIQALDVIRLHPDKFQVVALASGTNTEILERQIREFRPYMVSCANKESCEEIKSRLIDYHEPLQILHSREGLELAATFDSADLVVGGLPGSIGLRPAFMSIASGKDLALATKEALVVAGSIVTAEAKSTTSASCR